MKAIFSAIIAGRFPAGADLDADFDADFDAAWHRGLTSTPPGTAG